jgi:DNA polymerase-3 subunit alpha
MLDERAARGPFRDLRDLCRRLDLNRVNRRVLEALIRSGACDSLGSMRNRATLMHQLPAAMQAADQSSRARAAGQSDLFGLVEPVASVATATGPEAIAATMHETLPEWSEAVRLAGERETLGLYLTGHPIAEYERELTPIISGRIADVGGARPVGAGNEGAERGGNPWRGPGRSVTVAGLVLEVRKRGGRTSFILDDRSGRLEVTIFDDLYQQYRALIAKDTILVVDGGLRWDDFIDDWRLAAKKIMDVDQAREQYARNLVLRWPASGRNLANGSQGRPGGTGDASDAEVRRLVAALEQALRPSQGGRCAVAIRFMRGDAAALLQFGEQWKVRPSRELIDRLGSIVGRDAVELYYAPRVDSSH